MTETNRKPTRTDHCELCRRSVAYLTEHHLIPKSRHRDKKLIRHYGKTAMRLKVAWLCVACHKHIHRHINERDLAYQYFDIDRLRGHPAVLEFVQWIADKPQDFQPRPSRRARR